MNLFFVLFLLLPLVVIVAKEFLNLKTSTWFIFAAWVPFGWLLVNLAIWQHYERLDELVHNTPNPSEELLNELQSDGAPKVFALYFGWVYAAIYFLLCLFLINVTRSVKNAVTSSVRR